VKTSKEGSIPPKNLRVYPDFTKETLAYCLSLFPRDGVPPVQITSEKTFFASALVSLSFKFFHTVKTVWQYQKRVPFLQKTFGFTLILSKRH
jgi:hypothetical protein